MWYIIAGLVGATFGVIGMGVMSGRAYEKGYSDAMNNQMLKEITKYE